MYYDQDGRDERDFWADEPTISLSRIRPKRTADAVNHPRARTESGWSASPHSAAQRRRRAAARAGVGGRRHGTADDRSDAATADTSAAPPAGRRSAIDPLLLRLGIIVGVVVLLIPVALTLRDDSDTNVLRTAASPGAVAVPGLMANRAATTADPTILTTVPDPSSSAASSSAAAVTVPATEAAIITAVPTVAPSTQAPITQPPATEMPTTAVVTTQAPTTLQPETTQPATTRPAEQLSLVDPTTCRNTYEVAAGDYWILIAQKVDVTIGDLLAINGASAESAIHPGHDICLPAGATTPTTAPATTSAPPTTVKPTPTTAKPTTTTVKPTPTTAKPPSTTAAPATTEAPAQTIPQRSYSRAEVEAIIRQAWPDDLEDEALRIATRESNLQPTARNSCCLGLFQIYFSIQKNWLASVGVTSSNQLLDPTTNATVAYAMYQRSGWGPWAL